MSIKFHFFGKDCLIDRALKNRDEFEVALQKISFPTQKTLFLNQVHSNEVILIDGVEKIYGDQNLPKADAIVTNLKNIALAIVTADCAPVLLFDEKAKIIAAAHAGWRGAKSGILQNTVLAMKRLGATEIKAFIGPMIQQDSYEVSQEFFADFVAENATNEKYFLSGKKAEKYLFDLPFYVEEILQKIGVQAFNSRIDTYEREENFFSFRRSTHRNEKDCGRNISVIIID